ncbi:MAG: hypothetical protein ACP5M5_00170 [Acidibrevibacterium sp.]|uniref:hypothetical protein n=1 Tax=Acidibrevibacterium sp. TaxID=2606776 RepID=UPI003CFFD8E5
MIGFPEKERDRRRRPPGMAQHQRRERDDRCEICADLRFDPREIHPGCDDQHIRPGGGGGCAIDAILPGVGAEANHPRSASQGVIELAGILPAQRRDYRRRRAEQAALREIVAE